MLAWSKLTPKQRQRAREKYHAFSKLPPEKREAVKRMAIEKQAQKSTTPATEPAPHQP
jgi:hypothetical protein